jgi:tRNA threonylcarbamoyladenosine biosynthesis protein TsaE
MEQITLRAKDLSDLNQVANELLNWKKDTRLFALFGKMGSGKTTLIKAIGQALEVREVVSSPTFALVNEYTTGNSEPVFHFDFYRIKKLEEVFDIGYEEYFYSDSYCLIEWPELVTSLLPDRYIRVDIEVQPDEERVFTCSLVG